MQFPVGVRRSLCLVALALLALPSLAADVTPKEGIPKIVLIEKRPMTSDVSATSSSSAKDVGNMVREALGTSVAPNKKLTVNVSGSGTPNPSGAPMNPQASREYAKARAAALAGKEPMAEAAHGAITGEAHWSYEGEAGPANWGKLKPEFNLCAIGKRQSPINIVDGNTLAGPAEPVQFNYAPSNASVVNNGHTIQVDVSGDNSIMVRGSRFQLVQFHFHTPSEEQINFKRTAMVAHLVHRNDEGQLAVVAILLEPGDANALIDKVWTYMPLDVNDRVRMPPAALNMNELLPVDQRYYQFIGSLTTPPCTEGVLWIVLKTPMPISRAQYKLFTQLYPLNARPVQPLNGRPVRDAQ
jgi:carbonic anhydrase